MTGTEDLTGRVPNLIVVLGATASGKTRLAVRLAQRVRGEIISADSRQVYRGMDLGTGKDRAEYGTEKGPIRYHLIDILDPQEEYSVFAFQRDFSRAFQEIQSRGHLPILAGGTGLYLDAVLRNYDLPEVPVNRELRQTLEGESMDHLQKRLKASLPTVHNCTDLDDRHRILRAIEIAEYKNERQRRGGALPVTLHPAVVGIRCERAVLHKRIAERLESRFAAGMIEEVKRLHEAGIGWKRIDSFGLEYRYIGMYLQGQLTRDEMTTTLLPRIRQFAKRQETWFRRMERSGIGIHWIDAQEEIDRILTIVGHQE